MHAIPFSALSGARFSVAILGLVLAVTSALAQGGALYRVDFDATWSADTHPTDFPSNPHFSGPIGGTHDERVRFWEEGQLASLGIKRMAEWGSQSELAAEVEQAVAGGTAYGVVAGSSLGVSPGTVSLEFTASPDFPLLTLVTMIAPSPDWFVGVRDLDLRPGGQWAEQIVVELHPWDAGTDSGATYTAGDQPTVPPEPVAPLTAGPPTPGEPLGTFTITLQYAAAVAPAPRLAVTAYPNPFNPSTTIAWDLPEAGPLVVTIHDAAGRRIRELWRGDAAAGLGGARWDGTDGAGRAVASGTYHYRVQAGADRARGRLTLVR